MTATRETATAPLPSLARASRHRAVLELKAEVRNPMSLAFTLLFPVMMLLLFGAVFSGTVNNSSGVTNSQLFVAGIIGSSILSTGLVGLAIGIAIEREKGQLKRLAGTPMPKAAYFLGKIASVLALAAGQIVVLTLIGIVLFDVDLPTSASKWLTFAWVFVLGITAATVLGVAVGGLMPNGKSAPAIVNLPYVALQFISGVFVPFNELPDWLRSVAGVFPLRWLCQGMRSVFLPDSFQQIEQGHSWQHPTMAIVLLAWAVLGMVLCVRTFRFTTD
ncbi:MAG: ABC transporter permease [Acidimicrobiales bacterium]